MPTVYTPPGSLDSENDNGEVIAGEWRQNGSSTFQDLAFPGMNHTRNGSLVRDLLLEYVNDQARYPGSGKIHDISNLKTCKLN